MIKINLLGDTLAQVSGKKTEKPESAPVFPEPEGSQRSSFPIAGVLLGVLLSCLGGVYYVWLNGKVEQARHRQAELQAKKQELAKYIDLEKTFRAQKESLLKKREVMVGLKTNQQLPVHLLEQLADCLPDDVWFREISQKGMNISIKGESTSFEAINQFRNRLLGQTRWFQNVNYPAANKKDRTVEFTISCDLKNTA
ncbi:MAG: PilN domain-containing protein [Holophaga sp.]|nr:PilN domain-containing protein [Holophaga sp.]